MQIIKLILFVKHFVCLNELLLSLKTPRDENFSESKRYFIDWIQTKFYNTDKINLKDPHHDIRLNLYSNTDHSYLVSAIRNYLLVERTDFLIYVMVKILMEYHCKYFFASNLIYNKIYRKRSRSIFYLTHFFENSGFNDSTEFIYIIANEYLHNDESAIDKMNQEHKTQSYSYLTDLFLENLGAIINKIESYMEIKYLDMHTISNFGSLRTNINLKKLFKEIFKSYDYKILNSILPELTLINNLCLPSKNDFILLNRIYYMIMFLMSKLKIINFMLFKNETDIFGKRFIPVYKLKIFKLIKFLFRCHLYWLFRKVEMNCGINLDYIKLLLYSSYRKLGNSFGYCKENDFEFGLEKDCLNHLQYKFEI
ncbi:hypothetical protein TUBRATIS_20730 [Tubulinosema ratisbonensis]|uniref:Uncharacterized protein n=1 Tax=Tubulinosema ratisbonensis TaxID=291195 RepID=A0A437AK79_9MICR|nr:hypothetical protein TUBRATIS_20730 [Tubulinosema ratisbonensis]